MSEDRNPYDVLGVSHDCVQHEIVKAYRKLAQKYHPDRQGGDEVKFKELQRAYQKVGTVADRTLFDSNPNGTALTQAEIRRVILQSFRSAISENILLAVLPRIIRFLDIQVEETNAKVSRLRTRRGLFMSQRCRVASAEGVPNLFEEAVDAEVSDIDTAIKQAQELLEMLKLTKDYVSSNYTESWDGVAPEAGSAPVVSCSAWKD